MEGCSTGSTLWPTLPPYFSFSLLYCLLRGKDGKEIYIENEDGDKINLYQDDRIILSDYTILNTKKRIPLFLSKGNHIFKIEALNQGDKGLNTVTIKIVDGERTFDLKTSLKSNEKASITFLKN